MEPIIPEIVSYAILFPGLVRQLPPGPPPKLINHAILSGTHPAGVQNTGWRLNHQTMAHRTPDDEMERMMSKSDVKRARCEAILESRLRKALVNLSAQLRPFGKLILRTGDLQLTLVSQDLSLQRMLLNEQLSDADDSEPPFKLTAPVKADLPKTLIKPLSNTAKKTTSASCITTSPVP
ncbi:hypothetical protein QFC19_006309 [Naganishia cerealis]|uniref:Uncharacterized protein n=1 Tax=Naganishia cerealis TaxID=610337 RepID=A0ACC2VHH6_9TREE|nr:hypothetical protein QFC19_006309 [Naganishia cerealis]